LLGDDSKFTTVKVYTSLNQQSLQSSIMPEYSIEEYADMHFVYGECSGNASAAVRRYEERFPQRRVPDSKTILSVAQRLRTTGSRRR
jgi:hypothetical protein